MAIQNAVQRVHLCNLPPTTLMTGSTVQATLDAVDLRRGVAGEQRAAIRTRLLRLLGTISCFALGCATAATIYVWIGFWSLAVPVVIGASTAIMQAEE
jgi:uncharacterized membrane protein YoaK (UPF0700 family)